MRIVLTEDEMYDAVQRYLEDEYPNHEVASITLDSKEDDDGWIEYRAKAELVGDSDDN